MCCYLTLSEEAEVLEVRQGKTVCDADPKTIGVTSQSRRRC